MEAERDRAVTEAMERQFQRGQEARWLTTFAAVMAVVIILASLILGG